MPMSRIRMPRASSASKTACGSSTPPKSTKFEPLRAGANPSSASVARCARAGRGSRRPWRASPRSARARRAPPPGSARTGGRAGARGAAHRSPRGRRRGSRHARRRTRTPCSWCVRPAGAGGRRAGSVHSACRRRRTRSRPRRRRRCRARHRRPASIVSRESGVPVGLFGAQSNTTSGSCSRTAATAVAGLSSKSASRGAAIHSVPVPAARRLYIEYVGAKPSARAPRSAEGLQDMLQHLVRAVRRPELLGRRARGRGTRRGPREVSLNSRSGYRLRRRIAAATRATMSCATSSGIGCVFSLTLSATGTCCLRGPVRAFGPEGRRGWGGRRGSSPSMLTTSTVARRERSDVSGRPGARGAAPARSPRRRVR